MALKCDGCGHLSEKDACVCLKPCAKVNKELVNLSTKCEECKRLWTVTLIPGNGIPLTHEMSMQRSLSPLMLFRFNGCEPSSEEKLTLRGNWKAQTLLGTKIVNINLSEGSYFFEVDESGTPLVVSDLSTEFKPYKPKPVLISNKPIRDGKRFKCGRNGCLDVFADSVLAHRHMKICKGVGGVTHQVPVDCVGLGHDDEA
ncbi:uncharacterized protein [Rutidosis leptorrhynchoides]|uniref:uncharacterized protein isoform X2 n=1 Tax=Rutidosis leptorrhynchoides TaxID=125765 RepID=UPI003A997AA6